MFFDRFKKLCDERGISVYKACTDIGLNRSAVNKWKNGGLPNGATVAKFAKYFNVSADYLFGNVNDPLFYLDNDRILSEINSYVDEETPTLSKQDERNITKALETILAKLNKGQPENIIPMPEMRRIPLVGTIACGTPILADQNIEEYVSIPKNITADFALTCKGDSMINARIFDGDIVYIRQQDTVESGQISAVLIDGEATLKRVRLFEDHISLEPENPQYRPFVYWGEEMNTVRILGKAVAFTSTIR